MTNSVDPDSVLGSRCLLLYLIHQECIAPDKAAYCVFTQFRGPENAMKLISVRTKTQYKSLILNSELFRSV